MIKGNVDLSEMTFGDALKNVDFWVEACDGSQWGPFAWVEQGGGLKPKFYCVIRRDGELNFGVAGADLIENFLISNPD